MLSDCASIYLLSHMCILHSMHILRIPSVNPRGTFSLPYVTEATQLTQLAATQAHKPHTASQMSIRNASV